MFLYQEKLLFQSLIIESSPLQCEEQIIRITIITRIHWGASCAIRKPLYFFFRKALVAVSRHYISIIKMWLSKVIEWSEVPTSFNCTNGTSYLPQRQFEPFLYVVFRVRCEARFKCRNFLMKNLIAAVKCMMRSTFESMKLDRCYLGRSEN